jgi:hypothetical protein
VASCAAYTLSCQALSSEAGTCTTFKNISADCMNQQLQGFAEPCHFCNSNNPTCLNGITATHYQHLLHSNHIAYQPSHTPACLPIVSSACSCPNTLHASQRLPNNTFHAQCLLSIGSICFAPNNNNTNNPSRTTDGHAIETSSDIGQYVYMSRCHQTLMRQSQRTPPSRHTQANNEASDKE